MGVPRVEAGAVTVTSRATRWVTARAAAILRIRGVVRAPIWLFRARLGVLFGSRLLLLEHVGRTSGERRYAVLEVVSRPTPRCSVVASGFGHRAQWFRNVQADPQVRITLGSHRPTPAIAQVLTMEQSAAALAGYAAAHPRSWRTLRPVFETTLGTAIGEHGTTLPMVAFELDPAGR